jgi:pyridinium-3,5-biscarboxylic acid mononucleotide sulfurtransferase
MNPSPTPPERLSTDHKHARNTGRIDAFPGSGSTGSPYYFAPIRLKNRLFSPSVRSKYNIFISLRCMVLPIPCSFITLQKPWCKIHPPSRLNSHSQLQIGVQNREKSSQAHPHLCGLPLISNWFSRQLQIDHHNNLNIPSNLNDTIKFNGPKTSIAPVRKARPAGLALNVSPARKRWIPSPPRILRSAVGAALNRKGSRIHRHTELLPTSKHFDDTTTQHHGAILAKMEFMKTNSTEKQSALFERLRAIDSLIVAISGGADSAYLAWAAHQVLREKSLAVTAISESFSAHDREQLEKFLRATNIPHLYVETSEVSDPRYAANNADRCYFCKDELFRVLDELAASKNISAVAYGINADDTRDFRPGHRAAGEHHVLAPLLDCGLAKSEIRELSRAAGLPTWDRPASACLSSRIPFGTQVTRENLFQVERAESALRELGFRQFRVRHHAEIARIEIGRDELARAIQPEILSAIIAGIKSAGYLYVTLDLEGYRQGSLNSALKKKSAAASATQNGDTHESSSEGLRILK